MVYLEDWIGLYVDGQLIHEGHGIQEDQLIRILSEQKLLVPDVSFSVDWADKDWPANESHFPRTERELDELLANERNRKPAGAAVRE